MVVTFNKSGYDFFIDFVKAYAIICVLIGHTFPHIENIGYGFWAGMQVPLFVLVQVFHSFRKEQASFNLSKIILRIFVPYIIVQLALFCLLVFGGHQDASHLFMVFLKSGGYGPGSYFPWIYLQLALMLPFLSPFLNKGSRIRNSILAIIICEGFEIFFSLIDLPDFVYRLLAVRYFFLIYLGWLWVKEGIVINMRSVMVSVLSLISILYFEYFSINDEPFFYKTSWSFHRWPCYYYVAIGGTFILYFLHLSTEKKQWIGRSVKTLAKCSYEIFLIQMVLIPLFPSLSFITEDVFRGITRITLLFFFSILGGVLYNSVYTKIVSVFIQRNVHK